MDPVSPDSPAPRRHAAPPVASTPGVWLCGLMLVTALYAVGTPSLNSPWMQGDEYIFVVRNPAVTGPLTFDSVLALFTSVQEDLYQPVPILTYALEWRLWGDEPLGFRRTDLLLHVGNALLLWAVLARLLCGAGAPGRATVLAWALALLWGLHPALVSTWAAEMGRTHLLAAFFGLLALLAYLRGLSRQSPAWFAAALAALVLGMMSKPMPGFVLLLMALEVARAGWRVGLARPRLYAFVALAALFGGLTLYTSAAAGLIEDAGAGLFGDPVSRSLLAVTLYARSALAPFWLSSWYLPDPRTGWSLGLVWLGAALAALSVLHAWHAARRRARLNVTIGWVWFWALLLPVIGLVGARESAAVDRYLYQPLMGVLLVVGAALMPALRGESRAEAVELGRGPSRSPRGSSDGPGSGALIALLAVAVVFALLALPQVRVQRDLLSRAKRVVARHPGDPRALEMLANAYDFARNHPVVPEQLSALADVPAEARAAAQFEYFNQRATETLRAAARVTDLAAYFPGRGDRGPFHRRLAHRFLTLGAADDSLRQAEAARLLEPGQPATWVRLAQANRALGRFEEARAAYEELARIAPDDWNARWLHQVDHARLLLEQFDDAPAAQELLRAALASQMLPPHAALVATVQLARSEIRAGSGADGARMISDVLRANPGDLDALLVLAEYHLRSHHWEEARVAYAHVLARNPLQVDGLRGLQEACERLDDWNTAGAAWQNALRGEPGNPTFRGFLAWCAAGAADPRATELVADLRAAEPSNPLVAVAQVLVFVRADRMNEALDLVEQSAGMPALPHEPALKRAARRLSVLREGGVLPPRAAAVEASLWALSGDSDRADAVLKAIAAIDPDDELIERVRRLRGRD